jgi:hypothetical protein
MNRVPRPQRGPARPPTGAGPRCRREREGRPGPPGAPEKAIRHSSRSVGLRRFHRGALALGLQNQGDRRPSAARASPLVVRARSGGWNLACGFLYEGQASSPPCEAECGIQASLPRSPRMPRLRLPFCTGAAGETCEGNRAFGAVALVLVGSAFPRRETPAQQPSSPIAIRRPAFWPLKGLRGRYRSGGNPWISSTCSFRF